MNEEELIDRIRNVVNDSSEDEICRVIGVQFLLDVYDCQNEDSL